MRRREFLGVLSGLAAMPVARAQQVALPIIAFLNGGQADSSVANADAFRKGLSETGIIEGRDVTLEYHWFGGQYDRVPAVLQDLIRRRVAVIASPGFPPGAVAAKAATTTIPIVFGVGEDPVKLGLVASLARPGGNVTGINFFINEIVSKRIGLLKELIPQAVRIAVLVNPDNASAAQGTINSARDAAPAMGMQIIALNANTADQIDRAFTSIASERADALLVGGDGFLFSRRSQFAKLAAREKLPMIAAERGFPEAGGLMSYGTSVPDVFRQVGIYTGSIIQGTKPAELPVLQSTKFEFVINLQSAKELGLAVPPTLLARADEVIE